jgi:hypothetical protein
MVARAIRLLAASLFLISALPCIAELSTSAEIVILAGGTRISDTATAMGTGEGRISFQVDASREVKGVLEIDAVVVPGAIPYVLFDVPRAYVKVRFPWFRFTAGKTRLSWGNGFVFDAGDVIFGGMTSRLDLSLADPRDQTVWLLSPYVPVGDFSFIEGVALPFMPPATSTVIPGLPAISPASATPGSPFVPFDSLNAGVRAVAGFSGCTLEAGYLFDNAGDLNKPYVSMQTHLFFDLYAAAGVAVPAGAASWDDAKDSLALTCGVFRIFSLGSAGTISLRLEAGFLPYGAWEAVQGGLDPSSPGYGATVFGDITYSPVDTFSVQGRAMVSPVDASGLLMAGVSWSIYQGLAITATGLAMFGEGNDVFGWDRDGDVSVIAGLDYRF